MMKDMIEHQELCSQLKVSPVTLWRLRNRSDFPQGIRVGRHLYFDKVAVAAFFKGPRNEG